MILEYSGNLVDGLYYFYAGWNGKCQFNAEKLSRIDNAVSDIKIIKVNVTKFQDLKKKYMIKRIPTYIYLKNGNVMKKIEGNVDYYSLINYLKNI